MNAQKSRGANFTSGTLIERAKALIPLLIPLFVSSFKRAEELATAMECRCYHGGEGRTRLKVLRYHAVDGASVVLMLVFGVGIVLLNVYGFGYTL